MPIALRRATQSLATLAILALSGCSYISDLSTCDKPEVDPNAAIAACTRMIDSHRVTESTLAAVYVDRAAAYQNLKDLDRALADLDSAIQTQPDLVLAWGRRGGVHAMKGQYDLALADTQHAIALNPKDINGEMALAEILEMKHDYVGALSEFDELVKRVPGNAQVLNNRCWLRAIQGIGLDQALADCNESLRLTPGIDATLNSRGLVDFRLNRYPDAIRDYDAAIARNPRDASSFYVRGLAKRAMGDTAGATSDIESAKSLDAGVMATYAGYGVPAP